MKQLDTKSNLKKQIRALEEQATNLSNIATQGVMMHALYYSAIGELSQKFIQLVSDEVKKDGRIMTARSPAQVFIIIKEIADNILRHNPEMVVLKYEEK